MSKVRKSACVRYTVQHAHVCRHRIERFILLLPCRRCNHGSKGLREIFFFLSNGLVLVSMLRESRKEVHERRGEGMVGYYYRGERQRESKLTTLFVRMLKTLYFFLLFHCSICLSFAFFSFFSFLRRTKKRNNVARNQRRLLRLPFSPMVLATIKPRLIQINIPLLHHHNSRALLLFSLVRKTKRLNKEE